MTLDKKKYWAIKNAPEEVKNYLYIDIECVPDIKPTQQELERYGDKIQFMPEFNKIFCICMGREIEKDGEKILDIISLKGEEEQIIKDFFAFSQLRTIVGFNIKGFDLPFIIKRALYLGIQIPNNLKIHGMKPRELDFVLDLIEPLKYTGSNAISLDLTTRMLGLTSPKEEGIDGSMVAKMVRDGKGSEIVEYCKRDVLATYEIYKKFLELNLI